MTKQPEQLPAIATAEQGEVLVDGPNGYAVSLTPHAARGTARALRAAARKAERQRGDDTGKGDCRKTRVERSR